MERLDVEIYASFAPTVITGENFDKPQQIASSAISRGASTVGIFLKLSNYQKIKSDAKTCIRISWLAKFTFLHA